MARMSRNNGIVPRRARVTTAFTGAAGNGAVGTVTLFTITGRVWIEKMTAFVTETLVGATATMQCGTATDADAFIPSVTATNLAANEWWVEATGAAVATVTPGHVITAGNQTSQMDKLVSENVILTIATANITDGTIVFDVWYYPLTDNGALS